MCLVVRFTWIHLMRVEGFRTWKNNNSEFGVWIKNTVVIKQCFSNFFYNEDPFLNWSMSTDVHRSLPNLNIFFRKSFQLKKVHEIVYQTPLWTSKPVFPSFQGWSTIFDNEYFHSYEWYIFDVSRYKLIVPCLDVFKATWDIS